jgi:hypothetical protein
MPRLHTPRNLNDLPKTNLGDVAYLPHRGKGKRVKAILSVLAGL